MNSEDSPTSGLLSFQCEHCQTALSVPWTLAGVSGPCPNCGRPITAPIETNPVLEATVAAEDFKLSFHPRIQSQSPRGKSRSYASLIRLALVVALLGGLIVAWNQWSGLRKSRERLVLTGITPKLKVDETLKQKLIPLADGLQFPTDGAPARTRILDGYRTLFVDMLATRIVEVESTTPVFPPVQEMARLLRSGDGETALVYFTSQKQLFETEIRQRKASGARFRDVLRGLLLAAHLHAMANHKAEAQVLFREAVQPGENWVEAFMDFSAFLSFHCQVSRLKQDFKLALEDAAEAVEIATRFASVTADQNAVFLIDDLVRHGTIMMEADQNKIDAAIESLARALRHAQQRVYHDPVAKRNAELELSVLNKVEKLVNFRGRAEDQPLLSSYRQRMDRLKNLLTRQDMPSFAE